MGDQQNDVSKVVRGIRLDLAIAVCAVLISTLAAGASWWQARLLVAQTHVLEEQLGAQVWPYLSVTEGFNDDTIQVNVLNDGLGPAILRSFAAKVDGVPRSSFLAIVHAILGPGLIGRKPHGEALGYSIDSAEPGTVIRAGERGPGFSLRSKTFSRALLAGYRRLSFTVCYCAIIPGKCWLSDAGREPAPVPNCPEVRTDLLHASAADQILTRQL